VGKGAPQGRSRATGRERKGKLVCGTRNSYFSRMGQKKDTMRTRGKGRRLRENRKKKEPKGEGKKKQDKNKVVIETKSGGSHRE